MTYTLTTRYATYELTDEHGLLYEFLAEEEKGPRTSGWGSYSRKTWHGSCQAVNKRGVGRYIRSYDFERSGVDKLMKQFPSPGVFMGTDEQVALAYLFDDLECDSYMVFDVESDSHGLSDEEKAARVEELRVFGEKLGGFVDGRNGGCSVSLVTKKENWFGHMRDVSVPVCEKELPPKHFLMYAKKRFVELAQDAWTHSFLMPVNDGGKKKPSSTVRESRAKNLAYGLLVLDDEVCFPSGRGTGSKLSALQNQALNHAVYSVEPGDDAVVKAHATLMHLQDYPRLWQKAASDTYLSIRLPEEVLDDKDKTLEVFGHAADSLGLSTLVDAYKMGVDIDDILGTCDESN